MYSGTTEWCKRYQPPARAGMLNSAGGIAPGNYRVSLGADALPVAVAVDEGSACRPGRRGGRTSILSIGVGASKIRCTGPTFAFLRNRS